MRSAVAVAAAALMFGGYAIPSYADSHTLGLQPVAAPAPGGFTTAQSMEVPAAVAAAPGSEARAEYQVTKVLPSDFRPYAQTADTFVNDLNSPIQWPFLMGVPISSWFGYRVPPCGACSSYHQGLDMNPGAGTPIQVIADGVVTKVGNPSGELGVYAVVQHTIDGQTVESTYAHMAFGTLQVAVGDRVEVGDLIGQVGNSGLSTGPHLHFGISVNGTLIDPSAYLKARVGR